MLFDRSHFITPLNRTAAIKITDSNAINIIVMHNPISAQLWFSIFSDVDTLFLSRS
jgi:hypothetical protein